MYLLNVHTRASSMHAGHLTFACNFLWLICSTLDARPPPSAHLNVTILNILQLKWQWDDECVKAGRPPLNLMRVTRAYFFHTYGIRSAAEQHLAEFLAGLLLHRHRLQLQEAVADENDEVAADGAEGRVEAVAGVAKTSVEHGNVSYRALLFSSLLRCVCTRPFLL